MGKELFIVGRKGQLTTDNVLETVPILATSWEEALKAYLEYRRIDPKDLKDIWIRHYGPISEGA